MSKLTTLLPRNLLRPSIIGGAVLVGVMCVVPLYAESDWLHIGLIVMAAAIGAIGLNILTGSTGQLSMAHAFFLAVGAAGYTYFAGADGSAGGVEFSGLELPPPVAMLLAVLLAGAFGLAFSPIAGRLSGIYLGLASIALVFIGQHLLRDLSSITGGFQGRDVEPFNLFGFSFSKKEPEGLEVLGVPFERQERLWYLFLVLLVLAYLFAQNMLRSRPGRALQMIRDSEVAAGVMGVNVRQYKAAAFAISSMYAGLAGVLIALAAERTSPEEFGLPLSIAYLAMIVIGGLGSVRGAIAGAALVTALPEVLNLYGDELPFLSEESGITPPVVSHYVYGAAVVLVILLSPAGLAGLVRSASARWRPSKPSGSTRAAVTTKKGS